VSCSCVIPPDVEQLAERRVGQTGGTASAEISENRSGLSQPFRTNLRPFLRDRVLDRHKMRATPEHFAGDRQWICRCRNRLYSHVLRGWARSISSSHSVSVFS
jgi:hypothetical protein